MSLTKDGDGLLRPFEMFLFFFSMWQKRKHCDKEYSTKVHIYFVEVYSLHHWGHCMYDEPNDYSDHNIFLY